VSQTFAIRNSTGGTVIGQGLKPSTGGEASFRFDAATLTDELTYNGPPARDVKGKPKQQAQLGVDPGQGRQRPHVPRLRRGQQRLEEAEDHDGRVQALDRRRPADRNRQPRQGQGDDQVGPIYVLKTI
jgi:hypothetical protein